jgi:hypothetical protein
MRLQQAAHKGKRSLPPESFLCEPEATPTLCALSQGYESSMRTLRALHIEH